MCLLVRLLEFMINNCLIKLIDRLKLMLVLIHPRSASLHAPGVVYHLSKSELDKWDAEHAIELSESSHNLAGRKLSIMTPSRNPNQLTAKNSTTPETEI